MNKMKNCNHCGENQYKTIEILYRLPAAYRNEEMLEQEWADFKEDWYEKH